MSEITPIYRLAETEIQLEFIHASGPGGQNVNKVATAVQLRLDVRNSPSLPDEVKGRLLRLAGKRATAEGLLIIEAKRYRTREQNRADALERLLTMIRAALVEPKVRRPTKPTRASRERRLESKSRDARTKRLRRPARADD